MTFPTSEPIPSEEESLPPARRRRQKRLDFAHAGLQERTEYLSEIAHLATPSLDFYIFSLLAGLVMVAAILLDSPALYILVVLLAPFLSPVPGIALGSVLGSMRFLGLALGAFLIHVLIFFGWGLLAGLGASAWLQAPLEKVLDHSVLSIPDLALVVIGSALMTFLMLRNPRQRPQVASVALAYELSLPVGLAGFGLTGGQPGLFADGMLVFLVHLVAAVVVAVLVLMLMRFRPRTAGGVVISLGWLLLAVLGVLAIFGFISLSPPPAAPIPLSSPLPTDTLPSPLLPTVEGSQPTKTRTSTPTLTTTPTLVPTATATQTITPQPTPIYARVWAPDSNGAYVRSEPGFDGDLLTSLLNTSLVQVISDPLLIDNLTWVKVRTETGLEGWMVQALLATATPSPRW
ncbi:MAG TPA: SH3 domain-containing protein [Anaerolineaceae bacterium]|nr:SH3 domain-containing protein [Anaerolineaceae bacterium]